jgi:8-amino-7-oxononanoate synthase
MPGFGVTSDPIVKGLAGSTKAQSPIHGPVIPWIMGAPEEAVRISRRLREQGVLVQAIRPPTVPAGTSRLRITATARLSEADVELALCAFRTVLK